MLRPATTVLTLLALLVLAAPASSAAPAFTASGSYLLGDVVSAEVMDACFSSAKEGRDSPQEGLDSNCVSFKGADYSGLAYRVSSADLTGTAQVVACFYDATATYLGCGPAGLVPQGAAMVS